MKIIIVTLHHLAHIIEGFRTTQVAVFADRIIVVLRIVLHPDIFGHIIIPDVWVFAVFLCQSLGIVDMPDPGIVSRYPDARGAYSVTSAL